jgi:hypothetical protein
MRQWFRLDRAVVVSYLGLGVTACSPKAPVLVPPTAVEATEAEVAEWTAATVPTGAVLYRFKWLFQDERRSAGGRGSARIAAPDTLRFDAAGPLGAGKIQAVVVGDSAIWVQPEKSLEDLVPNYPLLWSMLGVARPHSPGATLRGGVEPDRVAWEYAIGPDTVQYLRTQGKSRTLYARVRHAGKTVGYSETTLSEDGRPTKAKLTVPSGPAKLTLTFYASVPSAAFPPETWLPPKP